MRYAPFQELETPRLLLRKLRPEDCMDFYHRLGGSPEVTEHMLWVPHRDLEESMTSIRKTLARYEAGTGYRWAIARREDDSLLGIIDLLGFDETLDSCSFAYMLGREFWGKGYGTEALSAVLDFAFSRMELKLVTADHFVENPASGAVMAKAGMTRIRTIPGKYEKNGIRHDAVEYRITKEAWMQKARR